MTLGFDHVASCNSSYSVRYGFVGLVNGINSAKELFIFILKCYTQRAEKNGFSCGLKK